jgi:hypothetical protein
MRQVEIKILEMTQYAPHSADDVNSVQRACLYLDEPPEVAYFFFSCIKVNSWLLSPASNNQQAMHFL